MGATEQPAGSPIFRLKPPKLKDVGRRARPGAKFRQKRTEVRRPVLCPDVPTAFSVALPGAMCLVEDYDHAQSSAESS
jgi:hypothetical protein